MPDKSFLNWPFFEPRHRDLQSALEIWCNTHLPVDHSDIDAACISLVAALGQAGFLQHSGGEDLDVRSLCLIRETLARHDGLADFAFAMQGLGMGAVSLFGDTEQRNWLDKTRAGTALSA
ncbi:MAG: acyl-CoA dehydrogenase, partial [Paracoccaceae bacterium]